MATTFRLLTSACWHLCYLVIRPPPPKYIDALSYPSCVDPEIKYPRPACSKKVTWQTSLDHQLVNTKCVDTEPIYQTLPGELVYVYQPENQYMNIVESTDLTKTKLVYSIKKSVSGKPLIVLEAIPVTLASSKDNMGVKTYAQLEVVAAGSEREGELICGVGGVSGCGPEVHTNGKAVLVPINGTIAPDKMIVDALLNECSRNESLNEEMSNGDTRLHSDEESKVADTGEDQVTKDVDILTRALEDDEKSSQSGEQTPLLQNENAQILVSSPENGGITDNISVDKHKETTKCVKHRDCYECANNPTVHSCTCMEFREHVTERPTDHVTNPVIYSEPEYSSSDVSIKCSEDVTGRKADNCQKTLKRTHNGIDHTVFELSPSDSFYSSADNVQGVDKGNNSSLASSGEGISRLGHSSTSLPDAQTNSQRPRQSLNRETSVSFKKPLVSGPSDSTTGSRADMQPKESVVIAGDAEPLVASSTKQTDSSETIPSHLILEDTRTYYNRKAADRGTLYCAAGGIIVVATIVFLLIYFS